MKLKKAIFDMDGLIFDSERLFMEHLGKVMSEHGYKLTREVYLNSLGMGPKSIEKYMKGIYGEEYPAYELGQQTRERMREQALGGLPVKKGIAELLEYLSKNNVECVVASSSETKFVEKYIECAGLKKYFTYMIGGKQVKESKPNPDIFLKALGDTEKSAAVVFEDSENGIRAAVNAQIEVICIPDMKQPSEELAKKTLECVDNAEDAIQVLEKEFK